MRKVFWDDPYQTTLTTTVEAVDGNQVLFADTIAFSFSGGQESDRAMVNDLLVLDSKIVGNLIYYILPDNHGLSVGDSVHMTIDWARRLCLMRLHFAAELILELVMQNLQLQKVGAHIAEHKARIDFKSDSNIGQHFPELLVKYNDIIARNLAIEKNFSNVESQRRYWKIDGFAQVPCGGTHVNSTAEVGAITLKRDRPGKGVERIEIKLIAA